MTRHRYEWRLVLMVTTLGMAGCVSSEWEKQALVLDAFRHPDQWQVWEEAWGGKADFQAVSAPVEGTGAIRFTGPGIIYRELAPADTSGWNDFNGISFWVKGDGSQLYGSIVVGPAGRGSWEQGFMNTGMTGHAFYFPLVDTQWHRVTAAWDDFVPEGPHPPIGSPGGGLEPGNIRVLRIGNRWKYWRNYEAYPRFSYEVGQIELVKDVPQRRAEAASQSVAAVLEKMRAGEPVRILCVGDSITAGAGTTPDKRYWVLLQAMLREQFNNKYIVVEGWGIGGATMLDALPWIEWMLGDIPPDLVTLMFGTNDCSGYSPEQFRWCLEQFLKRIARVSGGRTAVLPFATLPGMKEYRTKTDPYAEVVRQVMQEQQRPFLDLDAAFKAQDDNAYAACFADGVHLSPTGHQFVADTVARYLAEPAGPVE